MSNILITMDDSLIEDFKEFLKVKGMHHFNNYLEKKNDTISELEAEVGEGQPIRAIVDYIIDIE
jgi:hypothetical protein